MKPEVVPISAARERRAEQSKQAFLQCFEPALAGMRETATKLHELGAESWALWVTRLRDRLGSVAASKAERVGTLELNR